MLKAAISLKITKYLSFLQNIKVLKNWKLPLSMKLTDTIHCIELVKNKKTELLHSIRALKNDSGVKPYWEKVNNDDVYSKMDLNQKAEEVFSYIAEESKIGLKTVKPIDYNVTSINDIKNVTHNLQNSYLQRKMEQQIKPKDNHKQFRVNTQTKKGFKEYVKQKKERIMAPLRGREL